MGDQNTNYQALMEAFKDWDTRPPTNRGAFTRICPPPVNDTISIPPLLGTTFAGSSLACLRYLTRSAPGVRIQCKPSYGIWLDPNWTAPNARIAVAVGEGTNQSEFNFAILHPGEGLEVPDGFTEFYIYNADGLVGQGTVVYGGNVTATYMPLGACAFLLATQRGAKPDFGNVKTDPRVSVINCGNLKPIAAGGVSGGSYGGPPINALVFPTVGLSAIKVHIAAVTQATGALPAQADQTEWDAQLGLYTQTPFGAGPAVRGVNINSAIGDNVNYGYATNNLLYAHVRSLNARSGAPVRSPMVTLSIPVTDNYCMAIALERLEISGAMDSLTVAVEGVAR